MHLCCIKLALGKNECAGSDISVSIAGLRLGLVLDGRWDQRDLLLLHT